MVNLFGASPKISINLSDSGAADEYNILSGSVQASSPCETHAASRLSEANGVSVHSKTTYRVLSVIGWSFGSRSIVATGNYFDDTVQCS